MREYNSGKTVAVRAMVTPAIKEKVKQVAIKLGMSESEYIRHLLTVAIERSGDYESRS